MWEVSGHQKRRLPSFDSAMPSAPVLELCERLCLLYADIFHALVCQSVLCKRTSSELSVAPVRPVTGQASSQRAQRSVYVNGEREAQVGLCGGYS